MGMCRLLGILKSDSDNGIHPTFIHCNQIRERVDLELIFDFFAENEKDLQIFWHFLEDNNLGFFKLCVI